MAVDQPAAARATAFLHAVLAAPDPATASDGSMQLGTLFERLKERAFGFLLLVLALPCALPFVYILPQIMAVPMLLLAGQMALGRSTPWLPGGVARREFDASALGGVVSRSERYLGWGEALAHPRLLALSGRVGQRLVGTLLLIPCASILVPLPLTNTVPGIAVAIVALGLIERDGLLILLGLLVGLFWVAALVIGGQAAISFLFDFARGLLGGGA